MRAAIQYIRNFLTTNQTSKQTVIKNTFWLFVAEAVSKGSIAVVIILIGRFFGKEIFGQWSYLSVILTFLLVFADLGITQLTIRDRQHLDDTTRPAWLRSGLITKALLSIGVIIVYLGILWRQADSAFLRVIGLILLFQGIANSFLEYLRATFRSLQRSEVETRIKLRQGVGNLFLIPLLWFTRSLPLVLLGQGIITLATCGYAWWITHQKMHFIASNTIVSYNTLIQQGWMFSMSALSVMLYYYVDALIIQWYYGYEIVGVYNAAYNIIILLIAPVALLNRALIPNLRAKKSSSSPEVFLQYMRKIGLVVKLIAVPMFFILIYFHKYIFLMIYGESFSEGSYVFMILLISVFVLWMYPVEVANMLANKGEKSYMNITILGLGMNIVLNLWLIPKNREYAAITTLITEIFILIVVKNNYFLLYKK